MKAIIFAGPTIDAAEIQAYVDAEVLEPAKQGDVYRAARRRPDVIALIDGCFDRVASVWHKEILWAMQEGIHVFGAASMGALRAAELADFGMIGVGEVFRAFHCGDLDQDDEVAIIHGPADTGFRSLSEALVNVRATVAHAFLEGIVSLSLADEIISAAKEMHYVDRCYPAIAARVAASATADQRELACFERWRINGAINQKRVDAVALCRALYAWGEVAPSPLVVGYVLQETDAWAHARRLAERGEDSPTADLGSAQVARELRVLGRYREAEAAALGRHLSSRISTGGRREYTRLGGEALAEQHALDTRGQLSEWLSSQGLRAAHEPGFLWRHGQFDQMRRTLSASLPGLVIDHLRAQGDYSKLLQRAQQKSAALTQVGLRGQHVPSDEVLYRWYCATILNQALPRDVDALARSLGFDDARQMKDEALREYIYRGATL